jgi:hypothetical protein
MLGYIIFSTNKINVLILRSDYFCPSKPMQLQLIHPKLGSPRLESLLIVVPFFVLVSTYLFSVSANLDFHYSTTYFTFGFNNVVFFSWSLLIIPFLIHLFLKQKNIGDVRIIHGHIILSLLLLVGVLFSYELYSPSFMISEHSFNRLANQRQWLEATSATFSLIIFQSFLQLLFSLYGLIKLLS